MIWWLWTAFDQVRCLDFDVNEAWLDHDGFEREEMADVAWLGEAAWTARVDNTGLGLVGCRCEEEQ